MTQPDLTFGGRVETWRKGDARFPLSLDDLPQPPRTLYAVGRADLLNAPLVAIVGTRDSTAYGERTARSLARDLVRAGVCVVSGMARGIDAVAHRSALDEGGGTVAVLGTGIDVPYPAGHQALHRRIAAEGLVLSENGPGASAHKGAFPKRNRIIAGLARLTIVVEAGRKSGALNTATHALDLGRTVAAVPGPVDSPQSVGSNELLRDGAAVITGADDALALLGISPAARATEPILPEPERSVWALLGDGYREPDWLAGRTGLAIAQCLAAITSLEIRGLIETSNSGEVRRR
ncbi:MAG: DNA-processing protein DprA [Gemmatimonadota bacterium]|nr:DNA-processing protein DprA [Gemmatimonadota bacterium]